MKRNKKFYEAKKYRRMHDEFSRLHDEFNRLSGYGKYRKKDRDEYGRWNGYDFYLAIKKEARQFLFYDDLKEVVESIGKVVSQRPGGGWYKVEFDDESCKVYKKSVDSLLESYSTKEQFVKSVPSRLRYLFNFRRDWSLKRDGKGNIEWYYYDYRLHENYLRFLVVHRRRSWEYNWSTPENPEYNELRDRIDRKNLWPKIDRALGRKHRWHDDWYKYKKEKQEQILKKQMKKDLEEALDPFFT